MTSVQLRTCILIVAQDGLLMLREGRSVRDGAADEERVSS